MALSPKQISELNIAWTRKQQGISNESDEKNIAYAQTKGWTPPATSPAASGSLQGSLPSEVTRSLPTDTNMSDFTLAMKTLAKNALGNRTTAEQMAPYKAAGLDIQNPGLITDVIKSDTSQRASTAVDIYNSTMDMIKEQEAERTAKEKSMRDIGTSILQNMLATPFASELKGKDYEDIMNGAMSNELLVKWGEYLKTSKQETTKPDQITKGNDVYERDISTGAYVKVQFVDDATMVTAPSGNTYDWSTYNAPGGSEYIQSVNKSIRSVGKLQDEAALGSYLSANMPNSGISVADVTAASAQYGVGWEEILGLIQKEAPGGASGVAMKNNNYGGITWSSSYQKNHPNVSKGSLRPAAEGGNYVKFNTPADGVAAIAEQFSKRKSGTQATPINQEAKRWSDAIDRKEANITNVPENLRSEVLKYRSDAGIVSKADTQVTEVLQTKIDLITSLENSDGLAGSVGAYAVSRWTPLTIDKAERLSFAGGVHQLTSQETLSSLINLKAAGGTLGALSDQERVMLQNAATKISGWEIKDKSGIGTGVWEVSEADFLAELGRIKTLAQRALARAAGEDGVVNKLEQVLASNPQLVDDYNKLAKDNPNLSDDEMLQLLGVK